MHHFVSDDGKLAVVVKTSETLIFHNEDYSQNISSIIDRYCTGKKTDQLTKKVNTTVADVVSC